MKRKRTDIKRRLLDTLLEEIVLTPLPAHDVYINAERVATHNASVRTVLAGAQCIEASNIARFFEQSYTSAPDAFAGFWKDLKCLVPPFERFFIEWEEPLGITGAQRMGTMFIACKPDEAEATLRDILGETAYSTPKMIVSFIEKHHPTWIYLTFDFVEFPNKDGRNISGLRGPYHIGVGAIGEDGTLLDWWMQHGALNAISEHESKQLGLASMVAWTAIAMLNCHNIDTVEHVAPELFQRSRTRKGKLPLVSYRTIQVNLEKTPRSISAATLPGEDRNRLHQKRGHMKDYRKGNGLFGKYKGLWYWGPHLAGSGSEGVVIADYEVNAP